MNPINKAHRTVTREKVTASVRERTVGNDVRSMHGANLSPVHQFSYYLSLVYICLWS